MLTYNVNKLNSQCS